MVLRSRPSSSMPRTGSKRPARFHIPCVSVHHRSRDARRCRASRSSPSSSRACPTMRSTVSRYWRWCPVGRHVGDHRTMLSDPCQLVGLQPDGGVGQHINTITGGGTISQRRTKLRDLVAGVFAVTDLHRFGQRRLRCLGKLVFGKIAGASTVNSSNRANTSTSRASNMPAHPRTCSSSRDTPRHQPAQCRRSSAHRRNIHTLIIARGCCTVISTAPNLRSVDR